jgi:acetyl-CoA carboxylase biotin carboxyl carrier protein
MTDDLSSTNGAASEPGLQPRGGREPVDAGPAATPTGAGAGGTDLAPGVAAVAPRTDPQDLALLSVIDRLATILEHSDLVELEVQVGDTGLTLRKPAAFPAIAPPPLQVPAAAVAVAAPLSVAPAAGAAGATEPSKPSVKAPLTGIWYGAPAPGSAPYLTVGGEVGVGQVIGLIEAMKLFNEIKSDLAGRVVKIHAEDGKLVKAKQPLVEVEPL